MRQLRALAIANALWAGALVLHGTAGPAAPALRTTAQVKALTPAEATRGVPVVLHAVVTEVIPQWWGFVVQDDTGSVYVHVGGPLPAGLATGQNVVVEGRSVRGNFAPSVKPTSVQIAGPGRMPSAKPGLWQQIATGACDNDYIEVKGVLRSVGMVAPPAWDWPAYAMRLDISANFVWVYARQGQPLPEGPLVDAVVRVRGVCLVFANSQRQFQSSAISVSRASDIEVLQPAPRDPFEAPLQEVRRLYAFTTAPVSSHRVRIRGTVTLQLPDVLYVQQGQDGIMVRAAGAPPLRRGDRVEAVGFPALSGSSALLDDALVRATGHGPELPPNPMQAEKVLTRVLIATSVPDAALLRVEGRVMDRSRSARESTLILHEGNVSFTARLRGDAPALTAQPGSRVAVTGVCVLQTNDRGWPVAFDLLMRSPSDVTVLEAAPWFSRTLAIRTAVTLLAFLVVAVVLLALYRRRIAKQTAAIRAQLERQSALEQRYSNLVENASDMVYVRQLAGRLLQVNHGATELTGYSQEELLGMNVLDLLVPEERTRAREELAFHPGRKDPRASTEWRFLTKDGRELIIETKQRFLFDDGQAVSAECVGRDVTARRRAQDRAVTERNQLEEQLHHAQKLESVGRLAGGVAHDFNNLLTVITGYTQMVIEQLPAKSPLQEAAQEVADAANRAAALTRQLLLFSRRQRTSPRVFSLNDLVRNLEKMLRRLIGEDLDLTLSLDARTGLMRADPGHIEQVVMNLVVNARDAMPDGGTVTIRTADVHVGEQSEGSAGLEQGNYIQLAVIDTGTGMTPEVRMQIFEPYFTTKPQGKGTGLGLSTVYGIVSQSGGAISVYSEPGRGSRFEVLFPAAGVPGEDPGDAPIAPVRGSGTETILLVEDEAAVRKFIRDVLVSRGYTVIEAADGRQALEVAGRHDGPLHLLLTDLIMPEMSGADLSERFAQQYPGIPILHMSGYTDRPLRVAADAILQKPFTPAILLARVSEMLGARVKRAPDSEST